MNEYRVSEDTLNIILQYLGKKPFIEVSEIIVRIKADVRLIDNSLPANPEKESEE